MIVRMKKILKNVLAMLIVITTVLGDYPMDMVGLPAMSRVEAASSLPTVNEAQVRARVVELAQKLGVENTSLNVAAWAQKPFTANAEACGHATSSKCENCRIGNIVQSQNVKNTFWYNVQPANLPGHYGIDNRFGGDAEGNTWTCAGFANFALWYIAKNDYNSNVSGKTLLGTQGQPFTHESLINSGIRIGDVVRLGGSTESGDHSAMFLGYDGTQGVWVLDSNYGVKDTPEKINTVRIHTIPFSNSYPYFTKVSITRANNYVPDGLGSGGDTSNSSALTLPTDDYPTAMYNRAATYYMGYTRQDFINSGYGDIPNAWCVWFINRLAKDAGAGSVFCDVLVTTDFFEKMTNPNGSYKAQGFKTQHAGNYNCFQYAQSVSTNTFVPQKGDILCIKDSTYPQIAHVTFVYDFDGTYVYFVDGNGGSNTPTKVRKHKYNKNVNESYATIVGYIRPNYAELTSAPNPPAPTVPLPAAMTSTTSAQAASNIISYGKLLVGCNYNTFQAAGCVDIPSGDWNTWFVKFCGKRVGIDGLFSAQTQVPQFCTDMIQNYGGQGYYYTDSKWITNEDKIVMSGSQEVTKSTFTPQIGDIYILNEAGSGYMNQVGLVADVVDGSVYALVGNNGTAKEVQYRASTTNYFYQINHQSCPIIGYIRPNYASLDQPADTEAPKISDVTAAGHDSAGYTISCTITDNVGVTNVVFPTWTEKYDQDDLQNPWPGYTSKDGNNYTFRVNISDHNNEHGVYITDIYAYDAAGNWHCERLYVGLEHSGTLVAAKAPTCTDPGNVAYYVCACGAWFWDSSCQNVITDSQVVVTAPLNHNFTGAYEYVDYTEHICTCANNCGIKQREQHTDANNDKICDLCQGDTMEPSKKGLHVTLTNPDASYIYTGNAITPEIIVENNGEVLVQGIDYTVKYTNNKDASVDKPEKSKPRITVTGKKNLTGSTYTTFDIQPKNIGDSDVVAGNLLVATGTKAVPSLVYKSAQLSSKDYIVENAQQKFTKDGELRVTGRGNYTGSRSISVRVVQKSAMKKFSVVLGTEKLVYNGSEQRQSFSVLDASTKKVLQENIDYQVVYSGNLTDAGTVKFSVLGMGDYAGTVAKSYQIKPLVIKSGINVRGINPAGYAYSSQGVTIDRDLIVSYGAMTLKEGRDYRISYSGNKKISTAKSTARFTISFMGNFKGSTAVRGTFSIYASEVNYTIPGFEVIMPDQIYTGKAGSYRSNPYIVVSGSLLKKTDYTVRYYKDASMTQEITGSANRIMLRSDEESAIIYAKIMFKGNYSSINEKDGYVAASYKVYNKNLYQDLSKAKVTFLDQSGKTLKKAEYTGSAIAPKVKLEVRGTRGYVEVPSDWYKVVYVNNVNKGTATAIITGTGQSYGGSKIATFQITSKNVKTLADFWRGIFGISNKY